MSDKKKPDIPKALMILGDRFSVRLQPDPHGNDGDGPVDGFQSGHRIIIDANNDTSKKWRTLLHESMHGALYITGIQSELGAQLEEIVVQTMETHVTQFMRAHGKSFMEAINGDI